MRAESARNETERRRPGPRPRYSREELARRALAIMDAHGSEALTMRRLAEELGMGTMALYRYFPSKRDLMDAAIEVAAPEVPLPEIGAGPWKHQLRDLAGALFRAGLRHPSIARERFERPLQGPGAIQMTDRVIALLLEAGLSKQSAACAAALTGRRGQRDASAVALHRTGFTAGGPVHGAGFGALVGALSLAGLRMGELPRPLAIAGLASASAGLLSALYFLTERAALLIPAGRVSGLIVSGVAGARLSRRDKTRGR